MGFVELVALPGPVCFDLEGGWLARDHGFVDILRDECGRT